MQKLRGDTLRLHLPGEGFRGHALGHLLALPRLSGERGIHRFHSGEQGDIQSAEAEVIEERIKNLSY